MMIMNVDDHSYNEMGHWPGVGPKYMSRSSVHRVYVMYSVHLHTCCLEVLPA